MWKSKILRGPPPVVTATAIPSLAAAGSTIRFRGVVDVTDRDIKRTWLERGGHEYYVSYREIPGDITGKYWYLGPERIGSGAAITHTFPEPGVYTVTFRVTANHTDHEESAITDVEVTVIEVAKLQRLEAVDQGDTSRHSEEILQMVSGPAKITAHKDRQAPWPENDPAWRGLICDDYYDGRCSVTYTGTVGGRQYAQVGVDTESVKIDIVPRNKRDGEIAVDLFHPLLNKIQDRIDMGKVSGAVTGSRISYNVDQRKSPLVQKSIRLTAGGKLEITNPCPIKLYFSKKVVVGGIKKYLKLTVEVVPSLYLKVSEVEIYKDGTTPPDENPFTGRGKATLGGAISVEAPVIDLEIEGIIKKKATVKGSVGASGAFKVHVAEPKLSGNFTIGELIAEAEAVIEFIDFPVVDEKFTWKVFEGFPVPERAKLDLLSLFRQR